MPNGTFFDKKKCGIILKLSIEIKIQSRITNRNKIISDWCGQKKNELQMRARVQKTFEHLVCTGIGGIIVVIVSVVTIAFSSVSLFSILMNLVCRRLLLNL